jgi:hypothetical protein
MTPVKRSTDEQDVNVFGLEFGADECVAMEKIDIASIKVPVAIFSRLLAEHFDVVYRALNTGASIDDEWVRAQD